MSTVTCRLRESETGGSEETHAPLFRVDLDIDGKMGPDNGLETFGGDVRGFIQLDGTKLEGSSDMRSCIMHPHMGTLPIEGTARTAGAPLAWGSPHSPS